MAARLRIDSADKTLVKFGPDRNLPQVYGWLKQLQDRAGLT